jgi:hypothetical protein
MIEAVSSSETSVSICQTTECNIPEEAIFFKKKFYFHSWQNKAESEINLGLHIYINSLKTYF